MKLIDKLARRPILTLSSLFQALIASLMLWQWFISGSTTCFYGGVICVLAGLSLGVLVMVMHHER